MLAMLLTFNKIMVNYSLKKKNSNKIRVNQFNENNDTLSLDTLWKLRSLRSQNAPCFPHKQK